MRPVWKVVGLETKDCRGACWRRPPTQGQPEMPVWDPPLTLRQAGRLEGLLRRGWLFKLLHVRWEGGLRGHEPV